MSWSYYLSKIHAEIWPWFDPGSRLFYLNILSASILALLFVIFKSKKKFKELLSKNYISTVLKGYWLHPSAQVDYQIYIINGLIKVILFAPVLGLSFYISKFIIKGLYWLNPDFLPLQGGFICYLAVTIFAFVWDDFLRFYHHYLMHKIPFLWTLHKTHHSAEVLTPVTLYRIHPLESLLASFRNSLSFGVSAGVIMFLFSGRIDTITLLGVNVFGFIFNLTVGNLRHSQIPISFGWLEYIFISPKQHQLHHSNQKAHFNKNYGVALSLWDQVLGSFLLSKNQEIKGYGVDGMSSYVLKEQFWPWKNKWKSSWQKVWSDKLSLSSMGIKILFLCLFLLNSSWVHAENSCAEVLSDYEFLLSGRMITTKSMNLKKPTTSMDESGWYFLSIRDKRSSTFHEIPAYFEKVRFEEIFEKYRYPFDSALYNYWISGYIEKHKDIYGEPILVFKIVRFWSKGEAVDFKTQHSLTEFRKKS